ncbi:MAG: hypothetical protein QOK42_2499 [Frankiaceae bacterium]|nr:hypothetical protein [Frankiaceae bacterium]
MRRHMLSRLRDEDAGVSLVIALLFIVVVGIFADAALTKAADVAGSGAQIKTRTQLQYALDGGVERGFQDLVDDITTGAPAKCISAGAGASSGTFSLNGQSVSYTCNTLAGRAANSGDGATTNYAMVVTSPNASSVNTSNGVGTSVGFDGSMYVAGKLTNSDVAKPIDLTGGDFVSPVSRANCATDLSALTQVTIDTGQLKVCTEQTVAQAQGTAIVPNAPTAVLSSTLLSGVDIVTAGKHCHVFYPGKYLNAAPVISATNYFVSGLYYFENIGTWQIDGDDQITAGARTVSTDVPVPSNDCASMTDAAAMSSTNAAFLLLKSSIQPYVYTNGATWVFGGNSTLDFKKGTVTLFTPPANGNPVPLNLVGAYAGMGGSGYTNLATGAGLITGGSNNSTLELNAKLFAPTASIAVFSTNNTVAAVRGGIVAYTVDLKASASGSGGILVSALGTVTDPPPPFRTVKIVTTDSSGANPATNTAVATISNFSPYTVKVYSWRTA